MTTMTLGFTNVRPRRLLRVAHLKQRIAEWRFRARSRSELAGMNDRMLQDMGLTRSIANAEAAKPFWVA